MNYGWIHTDTGVCTKILHYCTVWCRTNIQIHTVTLINTWQEMTHFMNNDNNRSKLDCRLGSVKIPRGRNTTQQKTSNLIKTSLWILSRGQGYPTSLTSWVQAAVNCAHKTIPEHEASSMLRNCQGGRHTCLKLSMSRMTPTPLHFKHKTQRKMFTDSSTCHQPMVQQKIYRQI